MRLREVEAVHIQLDSGQPPWESQRWLPVAYGQGRQARGTVRHRFGWCLRAILRTAIIACGCMFEACFTIIDVGRKEKVEPGSCS